MLAGEKNAYAYLVNQYRAYVFAIVLPIVPTLADAEDTAQETFLCAYKSLPSYRGGSFKAWLGRIAVNCATDLMRRNQRQQSLVALIGQEQAARPQTTGSGAVDNRLTLNGLIAKLPPRQQEVIRLYYFEDLSYAEIATRLNIAERTAESTLYRARHLLRDNLAAKGER
ncbi:MAG: RNA polymerase sigma factor [bacterium]